MARHKHAAPDSPGYDLRPWCPHPTKKACDEVWTQYQHGHLGTPCVKQIQPSKSKRGKMNKIETCILVVSGGPGLSFLGTLGVAPAVGVEPTAVAFGERGTAVARRSVLWSASSGSAPGATLAKRGRGLSEDTTGRDVGREVEDRAAASR